MSDIVQGKNVIVKKAVDGVYYIIGCAISCTFIFENELIGKTDVNAGLFKKYRVRISDCKGTVNGVTKTTNSGSLSIFHFLEEGVRRTEGDYQFIFEDDGGNQVVISMTALVQAIQLEGDFSTHSLFDLQIQGTGGLEMETIEAPDVPVLEEWFSDYWTTSEGATSLNGTSVEHEYQLFSLEVLEVDREGTQYDIILSGTPGNRQCRYDSIGGVIYFSPDSPFNPGETVFVLFKTIIA
jgi:hypothetical protein